MSSVLCEYVSIKECGSIEGATHQDMKDTLRAGKYRNVMGKISGMQGTK